MKIKILFTGLLSIAMAWSASAQKISDDISPLKGQKEVNVVLDFTGTSVNGKAEQIYIDVEPKKKSEADKAKWLKEWNNNLRSDANGMLIRNLNEKGNNNSFSFGKHATAQYTIIVKVKDITTGFFAGPITKSSAVKADVSFVKTGETTPFATVVFKKFSGAFSSEMPHLVTRIAMSFGSLGMELGFLIAKTLK
ncbi:MAG: hypothetical protein LBH91_06000 [Prevotellaceae bacterium]|jgi:hypothetical protein|nr:hypothetical protein [Prevotellaceae bacterium]